MMGARTVSASGTKTPANSAIPEANSSTLRRWKNVPGGEHGPGEGAGGRRGRRLGEEGEEEIQTEDGKHQSEENAGHGNEFAHGSHA